MITEINLRVQVARPKMDAARLELCSTGPGHGPGCIHLMSFSLGLFHFSPKHCREKNTCVII